MRILLRSPLTSADPKKVHDRASVGVTVNATMQLSDGDGWHLSMEGRSASAAHGSPMALPFIMVAHVANSLQKERIAMLSRLMSSWADALTALMRMTNFSTTGNASVPGPQFHEGQKGSGARRIHTN